tara:strand:- start:51 stop:764 length:714 start_codon:yes stop_codon:yes gene_type:complete
MEIMTEAMLASAHDMKTSLYNIRNACHMMRSHLKNKELKNVDLSKYIEDIEISAEMCTRQIEISESLQGSPFKNQKYISFSNIVDRLQKLNSLLTPKLSQNVIFISDSFAHDSDTKLNLNENLLCHCITNLLINACTFTTPGHTIRFECKLLAEELAVSVSNRFEGDFDTSTEKWKAKGYTTKGWSAGIGLTVVDLLCGSEGYLFSLEYRHLGQGQDGEIVATIRVKRTLNDKNPID